MMPSPGDPDRSWCVAGTGAGLVVGPERALARRSDVRVRVTLDVARPLDDIGDVVHEIHVAESGLREFAVTWHGDDHGAIVAVNPAGENQVGWSEPDRSAFWLSAGRDPLMTSVFQRFLLRHITTVLLERDLHGRSIHAVTAEWGGGVLAVAGPTCSGKTRLMNRLAGAGLVGRIIDDDCPIITPTGTAATLVPRRYEVETARVTAVSALIVLSDSARSPQAISVARAHDLLAATPVPWPAAWLPADPNRALPRLPTDLPVLEVPARDEGSFDAILALVASGLRATS